MLFLSQKMLTRAHSLFKGSEARERCRVREALLDHLWLLCGVAPLPSVGALLTGIGGSCTRPLLGGGSPPHS